MLLGTQHRCSCYAGTLQAMETEAAGVLKEVDVEKAKTLRMTEVGWKSSSSIFDR
jgi:hypothetical protein